MKDRNLDALPITHSLGDCSARSWLADCWYALTDKQKEILIRRSRGDSLDSIGKSFGLTRERVRQLQKDADERLIKQLMAVNPELNERLTTLIANKPAVNELDLLPFLPSSPYGAHVALLKALGMVHPNSWDGDLSGWWTSSRDELAKRLDALVGLAPLSETDMDSALKDLDLEPTPPVTSLLDSVNSRLVHHRLGWIRAKRANRDLAYLWLQAQGSPQPVTEIALAVGAAEPGVREAMRRDSQFTQVRPEGTWALTDWKLPGTDRRYSNAQDVVEEVLRELGPTKLNDLRAEVLRRYPVSSWRFNQCLSNAGIGRVSDGRYDLAERGAKPVEETEPKRPGYIQVSGHTVGVRLTVTNDMLRGSGILVSRWLTWYLGLRIAPMMRKFELRNLSGAVTIKRCSSGAQISSLRASVQTMGLTEGCGVALLIDTQTSVARLHHACSSDRCLASRPNQAIP
ncbi:MULTISPECIES: sigma factor-like helix-turn-helix DNA-binding protein [Mycobacteroides]|uniref:sigma factor-like helix-turn-helix DNA-binding protein n=1 Tax=Mycobacteroides TaxID=670516 RepID=UPI0009BDFB0B